jgi:uncharacterized membrane protein
MDGGWTVTLMMGFGLLFTIALIGVVVWLVSNQGRANLGLGNQQVQAGSPVAPAPVAQGDHAQEIVRARYARGEIDAAEYDALMAGLRN